MRPDSTAAHMAASWYHFFMSAIVQTPEGGLYRALVRGFDTQIRDMGLKGV